MKINEKRLSQIQLIELLLTEKQTKIKTATELNLKGTKTRELLDIRQPIRWMKEWTEKNLQAKPVYGKRF